MIPSGDLFDKLLRNSQASDDAVLSDHEYDNLTALSLENIMSMDITTLEKLCRAEFNHLYKRYEQIEKRVERHLKRIPKPRTKPQLPVIRLVSTVDLENERSRNTESSQLRSNLVATDDFRAVIEGGETADYPQEMIISTSMEPLRTEVTLPTDVELHQVMLPRELTLDESSHLQQTTSSHLPSLLLNEGELDLGPPGDAGAFFGSSVPMPISDPRVRAQVLAEFAGSLGPPKTAGRFENLEVMDLPPPSTLTAASHGRITASTPIVTALPPSTKAQLRSGLRDTNISSIEGPMHGSEIQVPLTAERPEETSSVVEHVPVTPVQVGESLVLQAPNESSAEVRPPISEAAEVDQEVNLAQREPKQAQLEVDPLSSDASASGPRSKPPRTNARKSAKKVPLLTVCKLAELPLREQLNCEQPYFDNGTLMLSDFIEMRLLQMQHQIEETAVAPPQPPPIDATTLGPAPTEAAEKEPESSVMRGDTSSACQSLPPVEMISMAGMPSAGGANSSSKLYSIREHEPPQPKQLEEIPVITVSDALAVSTEPVPPPLPLASPIDSRQLADEGYGFSCLFTTDASLAEVSRTVQAPVETGTTQANPFDKLHTLSEVEEMPNIVQHGIVPNSVCVDTVSTIRNLTLDQKDSLKWLLKLYLNLTKEIVTVKQNTVSMERVISLIGECTISRQLTCRVFTALMSLKMWNLIDVKVNQYSRIESVSLRQ